MKEKNLNVLINLDRFERNLQHFYHCSLLPSIIAAVVAMRGVGMEFHSRNKVAGLNHVEGCEAKGRMSLFF